MSLKMRELMIPCSYELAAAALARCLCHFPRRDSTKDSVVVSDIAREIEDCEYILPAVLDALDEIWKASSDENPYMPPSGEVLALIKRRSDGMRSFVYSYENQMPPNQRAIEPTEDKPSIVQWGDMTDEQRSEYKAKLGGYADSIARIHAGLHGTTIDEVMAWGASNDQQDAPQSDLQPDWAR